MWWVWGLVMSGLGVYRRSHYALLKEQEETRQFQERLDAAVEFERCRDLELLGKCRSFPVTQAGPRLTTPAGDVGKRSSELAPHEDAEAAAMRSELAKAISHEDTRIRREQSRDTVCSFGPAFTLPFGRTAESDEGE